MKWLLVSTVMNLDITYNVEDHCLRALQEVIKHDKQAICIPAGENKSDQMFKDMLNMINKIQNG